mmetsp:Transcript_11791/g.25298  ORF Transcript_11791/g.25298 Transcript_11791/m.25298 type:complete len:205 (+) Transcript_11791:219-833(+)
MSSESTSSLNLSTSAFLLCMASSQRLLIISACTAYICLASSSTTRHRASRATWSRSISSILRSRAAKCDASGVQFWRERAVARSCCSCSIRWCAARSSCSTPLIFSCHLSPSLYATSSCSLSMARWLSAADMDARSTASVCARCTVVRAMSAASQRRLRVSTSAWAADRAEPGSGLSASFLPASSTLLLSASFSAVRDTRRCCS